MQFDNVVPLVFHTLQQWGSHLVLTDICGGDVHLVDQAPDVSIHGDVALVAGEDLGFGLPTVPHVGIGQTDESIGSATRANASCRGRLRSSALSWT